jgi:hypothetical protein
MRRFIAIAALPLFLAACQGTTSLPSSNSAQVSSRGHRELDSDCALDGSFFFRKRGGKQGLPSTPSGNFGGQFKYASNSKGSGGYIIVCPGTDNEYDVPVSSIVFNTGNVFGQMYSTTWLRKTDYYLYLYDGSNNFIESYQIGPIATKKGDLKFASPFENGFTIPADGVLNLEIVHPS